ncbi:MAG: hypothetical protein IKD79_03220 [Oscillospiraceae bacterium]|nr:hypothetical protein [Oscillospiraceae bacterium]
MADLEETLSSLLSSPETMEQLQSMARSLGLSGGEPAADAAPPESGAASSLPELDPRLLGLMSQLMREYGREDDKKTALLEALRPFLRPSRAAHIDRAMQIARLSRVIRTALHTLQGGEDHV